MQKYINLFKGCWYSVYWFVGFAAIVAVVFIFGNESYWARGLSILGAVLSLMFFTQRQKLDEMRAFNDLFCEFNERYKDLEPKLDSLKEDLHKEHLTKEQKEAVTLYFNLCAEEYLFYKKGLILEDVWQSWVAGMKQYSNVPALKELWGDEETASYYGFDFPCTKK